jgi:hypothetical protein
MNFPTHGIPKSLDLSGSPNAEMGFAEDLDDKRSLQKETVMTQQEVVYLSEVYNMN